MESESDNENSSLLPENDTPSNSWQSPSNWTIALTVFFAIITLITILGNAMTIAAFILDRSLCKKARNLWIISLSCADFLIGTATLPLITLSTGYERWPLGEAGCKFRLFFSNIGITAGIVSITAISIDNYLLMSRDYARYLAIQAHSKIRKEISVCWVGLILYICVEQILWDVEPFARHEGIHFEMECVSPVKKNAIASVLLFLLFFFIPLIIMTICSIRFLILLRGRLRKSRRLSSGDHKVGESEVPLRSQNNLEQRIQKISSSIPMRGLNPSQGEPCEPLQPSQDCLLVPPNDPTIHSCSSTRDTQETEEVIISTRLEGPRGFGQDEGLNGHQVQAKSPVSHHKRQPTSLKSSARRKALGNEKRLHRRYIKPTITLGLLLSVFAICNLPYFIFSAIVSTFGCDSCDENTIRVALSKLVFVNSCLNPFLYVATNRKLRQVFRTRIIGLCGQKCRF